MGLLLSFVKPTRPVNLQSVLLLSLLTLYQTCIRGVSPPSNVPLPSELSPLQIVVSLSVRSGQSALHVHLEGLEVNTPLQEVRVIPDDCSDQKLWLRHVVVSIGVLDTTTSSSTNTVGSVRLGVRMRLTVAGRRVVCWIQSGVKSWLRSTALHIRETKRGGAAEGNKDRSGLDDGRVNCSLS